MSALYVKLLHRKIIVMNNFDKVNSHKTETSGHHCAKRRDTFIRERERKDLNPLKR